MVYFAALTAMVDLVPVSVMVDFVPVTDLADFVLVSVMVDFVPDSDLADFVPVSVMVDFVPFSVTVDFARTSVMADIVPVPGLPVTPPPPENRPDRTGLGTGVGRPSRATRRPVQQSADTLPVQWRGVT